MAAHRPNPPRKRPAPDSASATRIAVPAVDAPAPGADTANQVPGFDPQQAASELLEQIDGLLRGDASIAPEERESVTDQFAAALREVIDKGDYANIDTGSVLKDSVDQLKQLAAQIDDDDSGLVRQLNTALAPLERRETEVALEFSRRLQAEGQESALAWLRKQQQSDARDAAASGQAVPDRDPAQASRDEVTRSRSRRLRGPPTQ